MDKEGAGKAGKFFACQQMERLDADDYYAIFMEFFEALADTAPMNALFGKLMRMIWEA